MSRISFTDVDASNDGTLRCTVQRDDRSDELWFHLPHDTVPAPDLIASAFASMIGVAFDEVHFDLPLGPETLKYLEGATRSKITHRTGSDVDRPAGQANALNFSGGFDSLAAAALVPDAELISLDFGGKFSRERPMFERFTPHVIETNLVDLGLNRYQWSFMGVGSILLRDALNLGSYSFGSIQAGSLPKMFTGPIAQKRGRVAAADGLGMTVENPVAGVSEIGALSIVARTRPEILADVLASVAHPGEPKHLRKRLMVEAVTSRLGIGVRLPAPTPATTRAPWGHRFADDLASLYVLKILGPEKVDKTYAGGIPDRVVEWVGSTDLAFMERFNPQAYEGVAPTVLGNWYSRLVVLGILPYEREDWPTAASAMKAIRGQL